MTDQDRGAYTPQTEAPQAFDARVSYGGKPSQAPVMLVVSTLILAVLVIAMALFYRSGVRGSGQAPQVIGAPVGDTKAPPPPSSQSANPASGLQIYKAEATPPSETKGSPTFTAPPEESAARPVAPVAPPVQPAQTAHLREGQASSAEAPAAPKPMLKIAKPAKTEVEAAPAVKVAPVAKPVAAKVPAGATRATVQIGAFSSPAVADKGWSDVAALLPGQMAGKTKTLEKTSKDGKTYYRTFVGGFESKDDAAAFCASLKAAGKSCFVK